MEANGRHILPHEAPAPARGGQTVNKHMCQVLVRARNKDKVVGGGGGRGDRVCIDGGGGRGRHFAED